MAIQHGGASDRRRGAYTVPKDVDTQKEGMAFSIRSMMEKLNFSMEKAMDIPQIPAAERAKYAALVKG